MTPKHSITIPALFERVQNGGRKAVLVPGVKGQVDGFLRRVAQIIGVPLAQLTGGDVALGRLSLDLERQAPVSARGGGFGGLPLRQKHEKRHDERKNSRPCRDSPERSARDGDEHSSPSLFSMLRGRPGNHDGFSRRNPFKRAMDSSAAYVVQ